MRIVGIASDCPVLDPLDCLVDHEQGNEEPLTRNNWIAEAVLDFYVEAICPEKIGG